MGPKLILIFSLFFTLGELCFAEVKPSSEIKLRYFPRPPFIVPTEGGSVAGSVASPTVNAFIQSGVPFKLIETPPSRQLIVISNNEGSDCAIGWLRNSEREKFARFSGPIYHNRPWVVVANRKAALDPHRNLDEWMKNRNLRLLVTDLYSYGPYIDQKIQTHNPPKYSTTTDAPQLMRLIQSGRADYMFTSEEEAAYLIGTAKAQGDVSILYFREIPKSAPRHIMCSKNVSPETIAKLNKSLSKIVIEHHKSGL